MINEREDIEAFGQIDAAGLSERRKFAAKMLVLVWYWEREHIAQGGKPLQEMTIAGIIEVVEKGDASDFFDQEWRRRDVVAS